MLTCFDEASPEMGAIESTQSVAPQNIAREQQGRSVQNTQLYSYLNRMQEVGSARLDAQDRTLLATQEAVRALKHEVVVAKETLDEVQAICERLERVALAQESMTRAFRKAVTADSTKEPPPSSPTVTEPASARGLRRKSTSVPDR